MQGKALPGFRDFYPDDLALRNQIFAVWRSVAARYGFEEYDGPPLEPLDLYTQKSGEEIVGQLYAFKDKGDRDIALRPEMTPTLARMVGARAQALKKPIRWFSIPQLFRYERQQRGRLREHFQLNMDIMGEPGPGADAEVIASAIDILRSFELGPKEFRVRISDRRAVTLMIRARLGQQDQNQVTQILVALDKHDRDPGAAEALLQKSFPRDRVTAILDLAKELAASPTSLWNLSGRDIDADEESGEVVVGEYPHLGACIRNLEAMGLGQFVEVDGRIVRGLAYYTGIVFELFDSQRALRAICGGGRYDTLVEQVAGVDLPCVGFGMGDVVLGELLKERGAAPTTAGRLDTFLVAVSAEDVPFILKLAHELRDGGVAVEYGLKHQAIRKQLELAAARGAPLAVIVGPDERREGVAVIRNLNGGGERKVPLERLTAELKGNTM